MQTFFAKNGKSRNQEIRKTKNQKNKLTSVYPYPCTIEQDRMHLNHPIRYSSIPRVAELKLMPIL